MDHSSFKIDPEKRRNWKIIGDPSNVIDALYQRNEQLEENAKKSANIARGLLATTTAEGNGWLREGLEEIIKLLTS